MVAFIISYHNSYPSVGKSLPRINQICHVHFVFRLSCAVTNVPGLKSQWPYIWAMNSCERQKYNSSFHILFATFLFFSFFLHYGNFMMWVTPSKRFSGFELGSILCVNREGAIYLGQFEKWYKRFLPHKLS